MHRMALRAVVVAFGALSASGAQSMEVTSAEIHKGATIKNEQVFKGFGCTGDNISPSLSWSGAPKGQNFRHHRLRSRRADRQRLVALGLFNIPSSTTSVQRTLAT